MKRRYWIVGADSERRAGWPLWVAFAGIVGAYAFGLIVLLPMAEIYLTDDAPEVTPTDVDLTVPEVVDTITQPPAAFQEPAPEEVDKVPEEDARELPVPCIGAMAAALSNARIEFLSSSIEIVPASRNVISVLAALSHACPGQIVIAGHSDNLGPEAANQQISVARAQSVADAFIEFGVEPERLSVLGLGSSQPVADNATREGRARNRRIEMTLAEEAPAPSGE